jgi:two-component system, sensor histidine kinase
MVAPNVDEIRGTRILVLAPVGRDGALTVALLERAGYVAQACPDVAALIREIERGAGAALLTGEVLSVEAVAALAELVAHQPPWSDFPFIVFSSFGATATAAGRIIAALKSLGNVSLLERPARMASIVSAVDAALRARRRQYEVRDLVVQLRENVRQRDEFLAMLSHELRNPLNALLMAVQIMDDLEEREPGADPNDPLQKPRAVLRRQAQILARLVDDLLEVARVTSGKVALKKARVDLGSLTLRVVEAVRPTAQQQDLDVRFPAGADRPTWVDGDATRLEQVLLNLLTNAIKYTPPGGRIEVRIWNEDKQVAIAVRDTGVGIDPEMLPRIFDLFRQAERTLDRSQGGLGIGLTLVRSLVELHGGSVRADSAGLGKGSEFIVRLPASTGRTTVDVPGHTREPTSAPRRIFVLEDHADNREGLVFFLQRLGHEVEADSDGAAGARRIVDLRPELAFIDIGLPTLDGYQVAAQVRQALGPGIFMVALTGYGQDEDQKRALAAGFDAHMAKPIDFKRLRFLLSQGDAAH